MLVGDNWLKTNLVGNFLLGRDVFETSSPSSPEKNHNTEFTGYVLDRVVTVVNTAELFGPDSSYDNINQKVKECLSLCAPGPHALVLAINPNDFDEGKKQRMEDIVKAVSEQAFHHAVIFIYKKSRKSKEDIRKIANLCQERVFQCWHPQYSLYQYSEQLGLRKQAFKAIEDVISKNNFKYILCNKEADDLTQLCKNRNTQQAVSAISQSKDTQVGELT